MIRARVSRDVARAFAPARTRSGLSRHRLLTDSQRRRALQCGRRPHSFVGVRVQHLRQVLAGPHDCLRDWLATDSAEVRILKTAGVLEAVPERPINADVRKPERSGQDHRPLIEYHPTHRQQQRHAVTVGEVVERGSHAIAPHVPDERQVRHQNQEREPAPTAIHSGPHEQPGDGDSQSFKAEQAADWGADGVHGTVELGVCLND